MSNLVLRYIPCFAALVLSLSAQTPSRPELTARELFYNASATPAPPVNPPAKKAPAKQVAKRAPAAAPSTQPPPAQQASGGAPPSHSTAAILTVSDSVPSRTSAPAPVSGIALGMKYTILKLSGSDMVPAAPSSVFHDGDKIQFSIETNVAGYLYIVSQGSSGTWKPMFPSPEIEGGSNAVEGFHAYTFPPQHRYVFDQQPGDERFFIVFSREPKPDFEQLVYSLQGGKVAPAADARPAEPSHPVASPTPVLRASIDEASVDHLHQTYARDLVIEKVGDDPHADTKEKAVYVVNASGNGDSAVVADLHLVHQ
jgi:hypothetical protein